MQRNISCVILAGGRSTRIGRDKSFIEFDGQTIIGRILETLDKIFEEIIIVSNSPIQYQYMDKQVVSDIIPGNSSICGIYTGLFYSSNHQSFFIACDMPFLDSKFIEYMIEIADRYDVVVPEFNEKLEPLHAIYSKNCMKKIEKLRSDSNNRIIDFFPRVKLKIIKDDEINKYVKDGNCFFNINTLDDLKKAEEYLTNDKS